MCTNEKYCKGIYFEAFLLFMDINNLYVDFCISKTQHEPYVHPPPHTHTWTPVRRWVEEGNKEDGGGVDVTYLYSYLFLAHKRDKSERLKCTRQHSNYISEGRIQ